MLWQRNRVPGQDARVEVIPANQHDVTVLEDVAVSQPPQLHGRIMADTTDRTPSRHHRR